MAEAEASLPPSMRLDIVTVIENLLLTERERRELQKMLAQLVANMRGDRRDRRARQAGRRAR